MEKKNSRKKAYHQVFDYKKKKNKKNFLFISEFIYNNTKKAIINYILFEFSCGYYFCLFLKKKEIQIYNQILIE